MEFRTILWMLVLGTAVATFTVYYNSRFLGRFVRTLLDIDATSSESAVTLEEVHLKLTLPVKYALRPDTSFSETVLRTEDNRYYIAPDKVSFAKAKYRGKDISIVFVLLMMLILSVFALAADYVFPDLIEYFKSQFQSLFSKSR